MCALRGRQTTTPKLYLSFRHFVPNKGLHPLRCYAAIPAPLDKETTRMKEIRKMPEYASILKELKPIVDGLQKIKFDKAKAKYKVEHEKELKQYYAVRRKLLEICPDGKYDPSLLDKEYTELEQAHTETYAKFKAIREEHQKIYHIHSCVEKGCHAEQTHQKKDHRKQEER